MPFYEVHHCAPLTRSEKDDLAARITQIHKSAFGAPSLFISITFKDISGCDFYAGPNQQASCNRIFAILRTGGPRTVTDLENLSVALSEAWQDSIVRNNTVEARSLSGVFVTRSIEALMEHGFLLPGAGKDEEWLKQNLPRFQKLADEGSAGFQGLLKELGH